MESSHHLFLEYDYIARVWLSIINEIENKFKKPYSLKNLFDK
jgi:hypothetical protein